MQTIPTIRMADFASGGFAARRQPCLISDGLASHERLRRWTPEYLAEKCGDVRVSVAVSVDRAGWHPQVPQRNGKYTIPQVPLRDAVRWITSPELSAGREFYVPHEPIQRFPPLAQDITFEKSLQESKVNIWFGTGNTVSGLHFDRSPNWYAQVHGSKQFILFSPDQATFLYPQSGVNSHQSAVDPVQPDLEKFPKFAEATPIVVTVKAGEILFFPSFWWHHVTSLAVSISVNQWWKVDDQLTEHCNETGSRLMRLQYIHDSWAAELKGRNMQFEDLLACAEKWAPMDQMMASLALCVVLDNFDRWPDQPPDQSIGALEADIRQGVQRLRQAVIDDEVYEIGKDTIAALARRVRHESVLGEFARGYRPAVA
jgi:hypothetical protein